MIFAPKMLYCTMETPIPRVVGRSDCIRCFSGFSVVVGSHKVLDGHHVGCYHLCGNHFLGRIHFGIDVEMVTLHDFFSCCLLSFYGILWKNDLSHRNKSTRNYWIYEKPSWYQALAYISFPMLMRLVFMIYFGPSKSLLILEFFHW